MGHSPEVRDILAAGAIRTVLQPIVDLDVGAVVAYEALSRGPAGPLESPELLFAAADQQGLLEPLDDLCRTTALRHATSLDWPRGVALFVNVEPQGLDAARLEELIHLAAVAPHELQVVLEITERAISARPAELLSCVRMLRRAGWRIALDDVGADDMSLAFMPLLRPDVVKLDLSLVQDRPSRDVARIMNAVNAYAQLTGAVLLAEGIEHKEHLTVARALGARLGQGRMFGRPETGLHHALPTTPMTWDERTVPTATASPFACLPAKTRLRRSTKPLLVEISKHLEQEALERGATCVVVSTFQHAHQFTPSAVQRYTALAAELGFVAVLGRGLATEHAPGVRGADLDGDDPLSEEWDVVVLAPHFAAALLARDLGDTGPDRERRFEFALTYERDVVSAAAEALLSRVPPVSGQVVRAIRGEPAGTRSTGHTGTASSIRDGSSPPDMLQRALEATTNGVTIVDVTRPDHPLIYVNSAFERLSGVRAEDAVGTNCRFLQGPDTDPGAVARMRSAIAEGREHRETLVNVRGDSRQPWWNEIYLAPVLDSDGRLSQYIGIQSDVTERVVAQLALVAEQARSRAYLEEMETLAFNDPLTGLLNRRRLPELLTTHLEGARSQATSVGILYLDVNRFKALNDERGHTVGDAVLRQIGTHLRSARGCLQARIGGDEFLVVLDGLDTATAPADAARAAGELSEELRHLLFELQVTVSVGSSTFPHDGADLDTLVDAADRRMYRQKKSRHPDLPPFPRPGTLARVAEGGS